MEIIDQLRESQGSQRSNDVRCASACISTDSVGRISHIDRRNLNDGDFLSFTLEGLNT